MYLLSHFSRVSETLDFRRGLGGRCHHGKATFLVAIDVAGVSWGSILELSVKDNWQTLFVISSFLLLGMGCDTRSLAAIFDLELNQHTMGKVSNEPEPLSWAMKYTLACLTPDFFTQQNLPFILYKSLPIIYLTAEPKPHHYIHPPLKFQFKCCIFIQKIICWRINCWNPELNYL